MMRVNSVAVLLYSLTFTAAVTFDWFDIEVKPGDPETVADFTQLKLSTFVGEDETIHYITGPVALSKELNETYMVHYNLQRKNKDSQNYEPIPEIPEETVNFCDFVEKFFIKYMLPITRYHNDFPSRGNKVCPLEPVTFHIFPVQGRFQLSAHSGLTPDEYKLDFTYQKDGKDIGAFSGTFNSENDDYESCGERGNKQET